MDQMDLQNRTRLCLKGMHYDQYLIFIRLEQTGRWLKWL